MIDTDHHIPLFLSFPLGVITGYMCVAAEEVSAKYSGDDQNCSEVLKVLRESNTFFEFESAHPSVKLPVDRYLSVKRHIDFMVNQFPKSHQKPIVQAYDSRARYLIALDAYLQHQSQDTLRVMSDCVDQMISLLEAQP